MGKMNNTNLNLLIILIIITALLGYYFKLKDDSDFTEDFSNFSNYLLKKDIPKIFDGFYTNIYDQLFHSTTKNQFEIYNINNYTVSDNKDFKKTDIKFLDLGCGTGNHLDILTKYKFDVVGIDKSLNMLDKARIIRPLAGLIKGNFQIKKNFKNREFTHITCFFFLQYIIQII